MYCWEVVVNVVVDVVVNVVVDVVVYVVVDVVVNVVVAVDGVDEVFNFVVFQAKV